MISKCSFTFSERHQIAPPLASFKKKSAAAAVTAADVDDDDKSGCAAIAFVFALRTFRSLAAGVSG
jgi:hypothetical protein